MEERDLESDGDVRMADPDGTVPSSLSAAEGDPRGWGLAASGGTSRFHVVARVSIADRSCWLPQSESYFLFRSFHSLVLIPLSNVCTYDFYMLA